MARHSRKTPVILDGLREVDFGAWTGLSWEEVSQKHKVSAFDWLLHLDQSAIATAECPKAWRSRVETCLKQILAQHKEQQVGIVCHGGVIRMLLSILLDLPLVKTSGFDIEYASVTCVVHAPPKTTVQWLNLTPWRDLS
jgi:broad specificity phosphatase PhoE